MQPAKNPSTCIPKIDLISLNADPEFQLMAPKPKQADPKEIRQISFRMTDGDKFLHAPTCVQCKGPAERPVKSIFRNMTIIKFCSEKCSSEDQKINGVFEKMSLDDKKGE